MRFWRKAVGRAGLCGLFAAVIALGIFLPSTMHRAFAADNSIANLSLYERASELTREFATAIAPGADKDGNTRLYMLEATKTKSLLVPGNAGALLGYADVLSDDKGIVGWLMNSYTAASATISYDQLINVINTGDVDGDGDVDKFDAGAKNPLYQYAVYGEALTNMGLVSASRAGMISSMFRGLGALIMMAAYVLANIAPFLFRLALLLLVTFNPFRLFETVINGTASANLGMISGLANYVGSIYKVVQDFSVAILLPSMLAIMLVSVLMFTKGSAMKKFTRYGLRVFMLFAGLPLIGATYTGLINDMNSQVKVGSEYADYLVYSSYVNFADWVKYSRLAPPKNEMIYNPQFSGDNSTSVADRSMILEINGTRAANTRAYDLSKRYSATSNLNKIFKTGGSTKNVDDSTYTSDQSNSFLTVLGMLWDNMKGTRYSSSDYDGEVSGQIQHIRAAANDADRSKIDADIVHMYSLTASDNRTWSQKLNPFNGQDWLKPIVWNGQKGANGPNSGDDYRNSAKGLFTAGAALNPVFQFGRYKMNIYNSGDLRFNSSGGYYAPSMPDIVTKKAAPIGLSSTNRTDSDGGLSPIAMYNFLNTTFSSTGLTVYSPTKTASDLSRDSYMAVTFAGSGINKFTRWLEDVTVMFCLAILAIMYGIMMVEVAMKSIPRILSSVFGTALGSIAFMTKLLISTAVLLVQVLGIIFFYAFSENVIMTLLLNFDSLMGKSGEYFGFGVLFDILNSIMVVLVTGAVTWFMIKNANTFREMLEEVVSTSINRLMGMLDTSTGGQGLDIGKSTGGRIGSNGKLTDDHKDEGLVGGAARILSDANNIEGQREQNAQEMGQAPKSFGTRLRNRLGTASELAEARNADGLKKLAGVKGNAYNRELKAKEEGLKAMTYNPDFDAKNPDDAQNAAVKKPTNDNGQVIDENGEVLRDENGNAVDENGQPISAASPLSSDGKGPMVAEDGSLVDANGDSYTDENGNAFYQNDKGQLVDEDGHFVALDQDGTLQPIDELMDGNGKPVDAAKEAAKLDAMRFDPEQYSAMKDAQDASHYGLDKDGNAVDKDGNALQMKGKDGPEPVSMDAQGYVTDAQGNRVPASDLIGDVDSRGFDTVKDPETGQDVLKHKGDRAMKNMGAPSKNANLTTLARRAGHTYDVAERAAERASDLKKAGASPYAVAQAARFAKRAAHAAQTAQNQFAEAMKGDQGHVNSNVKQAVSRPITAEHVASSQRYAKAQAAALQKGQDELAAMKKSGASAQTIARQVRKVDAQRHEAQQASVMARDMQTAKKAGRSYQEVHQASERVRHAEQVFSRAQDSYDAAVASGASKQVIAQRAARVAKASQVMTDAEMNRSRVSQAPAGNRQMIDRATARHEQAKTQYRQAEQAAVKARQSGASPKDVQAADRQVARASRQVQQTKAERDYLVNPSGWQASHAQTPRVQNVPKVSPSKSYATLTANGVTNYADYQKQMSSRMQTFTQNQSKLKQAQDRLRTLQSGHRPPQIVDQARAQVSQLKEMVQQSRTNVNVLRMNAQGLLKTGHFQPSVASRPIRQNGTAIINQMVNLGQTQAMYDRLVSQQKSGTLGAGGAKQMKTLQTRMSTMRTNLVRSGIREDALLDRTHIESSARHMKQSWDAFVNGKSIENNED